MPEITIPHNFTPRHYQVPLLRALDQGCKRAVQVWHRRSGKEKTDLAAITVKKMLERVGSYYYVFPEFLQGRKVLWDGADKDGFRFINHFPASLISDKNDTEMKIRLKNGSLFQIIGSDRYDAVMGTNPIGMVFSEYSLQDPLCWSFFRPILAENDGWALFNLTPRGENHAYDLFEMAKNDPFDPIKAPRGWYCSLLTVDDTGVVPKDVLEQERKEIVRLHGNDALFQQEYYCSFTVPIAGAYYADQIAAAYANGRIGVVPHEPRIQVDTWWDLGLNDKMSIWFTQSVGQELRVIDYMEGSGQGLPHYFGLLKEKPYVYGRHTAPHDINVRELSNGKSRLDTAAALGFNFRIAPKLPVLDGIDAVRALFNKIWIDRTKCGEGINALKNYRKQYDDARHTYLKTPYHDWSSNGADAFRTMAVAIDHKYKSAEVELDKYARGGKKRADGGGSPLSILG